VESSFVLSTKLTAEGPTRLKEEYVEGSLSTPNVSDVPSQLKGFYDQLVATLKRLPAAMKDVVSDGIKVPLSTLLTCSLSLRVHEHSIYHLFVSRGC
jgi:hypothetical protein